jgi:hypothetical protein
MGGKNLDDFLTNSFEDVMLQFVSDVTKKYVKEENNIRKAV